MSLNAALNATIALIENRPAQFREMLREPSSDVKNIPPVVARMTQALDFYGATKIRAGLMQTLHVQPHTEAVAGLIENDAEPPEIYDAGFLDGVRQVEKIFEQIVEQLEKK